MRVDEKEVDGSEHLLDEERQKTRLAQHEESEHPELGGEAAHAHEQQRDDKLLAAMRTIFAQQHVEVSRLQLPKHEERALEALQAAVTGRTTNLDTFVFASDRRSLLEQALAVLQPNLVGRDLPLLVGSVTALRDQLMDLEDGQDDLMVEQVFPAKAATDADQDEPPSDPDAPRPASQLAGPGPEVQHERLPTTLTGSEVTHERVPTTLTGPELQDDRPPASPPTTTLGDAEEIASAAKKPWWRRPFG